jgi:uncharacterized protein YecE (DUF72 family)
MNVLVGTASWTDSSLIAAGTFYPEKSMSAEARLRHYAREFPIVEVDSSYYGLPAERNARLWVERTPAGFVFDVKAYRLFTGHHTPPGALPKDLRAALGAAAAKNLYYKDVPREIGEELWRRFRAGIAPLRAAGKLGLVLLQFPPWVHRSPRALEHLLACQAMLAGHRLAVEFRHHSWFEGPHREDTLAFERDRGLVHVVTDEPQGYANSVPAIWEATCADYAYVRLHGRNAATWNAAGLASSAQRFDYLYSDAELAAFAGALRHLACRVSAVHVLFNTNYGDQGVVNGRRLAQLLGG